MCHGCSFLYGFRYHLHSLVALGVYILSIQNIISSLIDQSGIGAGTDRVWKKQYILFLFPRTESRSGTRLIRERALFVIVFLSFFYFLSFHHLYYSTPYFTLLLYSGRSRCMLQLHPRAYGSQLGIRAHLRIPTWKVFKTMTRNAISQDSSLTTMSAISERQLQSSSRTWNTDRLGARLGVDVASAATAGALTCPVITVIDR